MQTTHKGNIGLSARGMMTFDARGYPDEETLKKIEKISPFDTPVSEIIEYLREHWEYANMDYFEWDEYNTLKLHTGGWSGNESIIKALQKGIFWLLFWRSTECGGHYTFKIEYTDGVLRRV